jgi:hypothetical protein
MDSYGVIVSPQTRELLALNAVVPQRIYYDLGRNPRRSIEPGSDRRASVLRMLE